MSGLPGVGLEPYYRDDWRVIYKGDCRDVLVRLAAYGVLSTAVVTDPPYELGFMGRSWDSRGVSFDPETWRVVRDACLPGAPMLAFGGARTQHRIACAIEDAGWEVRDCIMWVYSTGLPKSLDISKAIDKAAGVERAVVGSKVGLPGYSLGHQGVGGVLAGRADGSLDNSEGECAITAPATLEAQFWSGWGTALKPAYEPIILAMNPLDGTFAGNALKHGVAGLNIDGCRIPTNGEVLTFEHTETTGAVRRGYPKDSGERHGADREDIVATERRGVWENTKGRFPANLVHDGSDEVLALFPDSRTARVVKPCPSPEIRGYRWGTLQGNRGERGYDGDGSAARFFYCAKASRAERDLGLSCLPLSTTGGITGGRHGGSPGLSCPRAGAGRTSGGRNTHPTVKPLALMDYLCKLVRMPERNLVLDPFCGSGTTLLACGNLGIRSIGIDSDEQSCEIAAERCAADVAERIRGGVSGS